jgi:predicted Zn-dependent protease
MLLRGQALLQAADKAPQPDALRAAQIEDVQTWLALHPRDAGAWLQLAQLWQAQGQALRAVRAEAEAHAARYDYAAAVDRFKAGQDLARRSTTAADFVEASIIDTRLRAVESLLREQAAER